MPAILWGNGGKVDLVVRGGGGTHWEDRREGNCGGDVVN